MLLELLVAFLQAYVFAILTCIYLNEALHLHDHITEHREGNYKWKLQQQK